MTRTPAARITLVLALAALSAITPAAPAGAVSSIRVGIADQSPAMFSNPLYTALHLRRTRYFVAADVMRDSAERARARAFVIAARQAGVSTLLHISTSDLRSKRGPLVSTSRYRSDVARIARYFRNLGVRDFGAWNEVNHSTQETWNRPGHAASYFRSMYRAVKSRCRSCSVVALDVLDQAGVERYIRSFYGRLSSTWRKRATIVGIHNYSDVNRNRSTGTSRIIRAVRRYNRGTDFWFTETGGLASFRGSFPFDEARQAARLRNMFTYANRYRTSGVTRVYEYNWTGLETGGCGSACRFDAGLIRPDGSPRPAYDVFRARIKGFRR